MAARVARDRVTLASAAATAFLINPKAALGDDAAEAIDDAQFADARIDAGGQAALRATDVLASYLYERAFLQSEFGYATAIAVAMFLLVLTLSTVLLRVTQRESLEY